MGGIGIRISPVTLGMKDSGTNPTTPQPVILSIWLTPWQCVKLML
jgi:hypothetical protein